MRAATHCIVYYDNVQDRKKKSEQLSSRSSLSLSSRSTEAFYFPTLSLPGGNQERRRSPPSLPHVVSLSFPRSPLLLLLLRAKRTHSGKLSGGRERNKGGTGGSLASKKEEGERVIINIVFAART